MMADVLGGAFRRIIIVASTTNDRTALRLKNLNSEMGEKYKEHVNPSLSPVVLQSGIHSDINGLKDLGQDLAGDGFNVWLTEMIGGPYQDEDCGTSCPNYTFSDLTVYYWPALIAGVEAYTDKHNLSYIGFSLGCTMVMIDG